MSFDKEIFKRHYGRSYIQAVYVQFALIVLSLIVRLIELELLYLPAAAVILLECMITIPLTFCYYIRAKKQAQRQKQWFSNGKLYARLVPDSGLTAGGFVHHERTYLFDHVDSVQVTKRYLVIQGDIHLVDQFNGNARDRELSVMKLPRVFTGEEQILFYGGNRK